MHRRMSACLSAESSLVIFTFLLLLLRPHPLSVGQPLTALLLNVVAAAAAAVLPRGASRGTLASGASWTRVACEPESTAAASHVPD